jgi:DNA-binding MarR family transcriptional regulator
MFANVMKYNELFGRTKSLPMNWSVGEIGVRHIDALNTTGGVRRRGAAAAELGEIGEQVGYMLRRAQLAVFADFSAHQRGPITRPGEYAVLAVIGRNPGLSQSQLCAALGIKRANLVAVIDHLESLDLARRELSAADRRSNRLRLTAAGQRALRIAIDGQAKQEARIIRLLGVAGTRVLLKQLAKLCKLRMRSRA